MSLLFHLLDADPATPRLTVYNESTGARMDFSAQTLDNWVAKIANFLEEELDLGAEDAVAIDLPPTWQAAVIALGSMATGGRFELGSSPAASEADVVFASPGVAEDPHGRDLVVVTNDPFGRGVVECGGELPVGAIDFGPTVRFYGDQYFGPAPLLSEAIPTDLAPGRYLSTGWTSAEGFRRTVLEPLSAGGSAVVVTGMASAERLSDIAANEKVDERLD